MHKIRVLKPFMFTSPPEEGVRLATERKFFPGVHEVPDEVANHPWIKSGADGKIESAAARVKREEEEVARQKVIDAENVEATAKAEAAISRMAAAEAVTSKASKEEIEKELNTPVSELRKKGPGAGVTAK